MRYSHFFPKTQKNTPSDAQLISHKLLHQAGFIRDSVAGRYYLLPLAIRVQQKIQKIIKDEMDNLGYLEMLTPVLHPKTLWKETNRTNSVGFELMTIKDRGEFEFVLGGTAEEMFVDLIRKFQISYKDLPIRLYQFSLKFRDEKRARGGLLRLREFLMKDGYSFNTDEEEFKSEYDNMWQAYLTIFKRMGLETIPVLADNGYIGGEYCHEFVVESEAGESRYFVTEDLSYIAHEDVAKFSPDRKNTGDKEEPLKEVKAVRGTTMEDGVKFHKLPLWQQIKDVLFVDERGRFILAIIRGDYDVNETKLLHVAKSYQLRPATEEEIRETLHSEPGFISPVGIKKKAKKEAEIVIVADDSLSTIKNAYGGANQKNKDLMNVNLGRDYQPDVTGDIALAKDGFGSPNGAGSLIAKKGIEVGNIFQLGYHYTHMMKDSEFIDKDGKAKPFYMGCYGIGVPRTLAAIVEKYNDDKGIIWPESVAPFKVHLVGLDLDNLKIKAEAEKVYKILQSHEIEVLYDDRVDISPGGKFADADLIGIPYRVVISKRSGEKLELKRRSEDHTSFVGLQELINMEILNNGKD